MSLLPRYARLPFDNQHEFQRDVCEWIGRWPAVREFYGGAIHDADAHDPPGSRVIHFPGTAPPPGSIPLGSLLVAVRPESGAPMITDRAGTHIRPAFFGMSSYHTLPSMLRFALYLGNPEMTVLESVCSTVQSTLAAVFRRLTDKVVNLPEVTLGARILLSPRLWFVPALSLPNVEAPVRVHSFVRFHDWLAKWEMPSRLVQAIRPGQEPQWVDLGNPEGVNNFLRIFRSSPVAIVSDSFLERDEDGLRSVQGWYEPEYYAEVAGDE
jgi:hypothetical protein